MRILSLKWGQKYLKIGAAVFFFFLHHKKNIDVSPEVTFDNLMLIFSIKMDLGLIYNRVYVKMVKIWKLWLHVKISYWCGSELLIERELVILQLCFLWVLKQFLFFKTGYGFHELNISKQNSGGLKVGKNGFGKWRNKITAWDLNVKIFVTSVLKDFVWMNRSSKILHHQRFDIVARKTVKWRTVFFIGEVQNVEYCMLLIKLFASGSVNISE